jgi:hypothetical protein
MGNEEVPKILPKKEDVEKLADEKQETGGENFGEEKEKEVAEDKEVEAAIEESKEEIKAAAEEWLETREKEIKKEGKNRILKFALGGAGILGSAMAADLGRYLYYLDTTTTGITDLKNPNMYQGLLDAETIVAAAITIILAAAAGAIGGALAGKFRNYFDRRKFKKQKGEIEQATGKRAAPFEDIKNSLEGLKK